MRIWLVIGGGPHWETQRNQCREGESVEELDAVKTAVSWWLSARRGSGTWLRTTRVGDVVEVRTTRGRREVEVGTVARTAPEGGRPDKRDEPRLRCKAAIHQSGRSRRIGGRGAGSASGRGLLSLGHKQAANHAPQRHVREHLSVKKGIPLTSI